VGGRGGELPGSRAAGVNHINEPEEQIGSGEAVARSAQLHALTSKAALKGGREGGRGGGRRTGPNSSKAL